MLFSNARIRGHQPQPPPPPTEAAMAAALLALLRARSLRFFFSISCECSLEPPSAKSCTGVSLLLAQPIFFSRNNSWLVAAAVAVVGAAAAAAAAADAAPVAKMIRIAQQCAVCPCGEERERVCEFVGVEMSAC